MHILITGAWSDAAKYIPTIQNMQHQVFYLKNESDPLPCHPADIDYIIGNGIFLKHPIEQFTNLRFVQLTSAGYDRMPMDYATEHVIEVFNARGVYSIPMAEHAIAGVLQIYRGARKFMANQREHRWEKQRNLPELNGKVVAIIGCGSVGAECAKRFKVFNSLVVGVDQKEETAEDGTRIRSIDSLNKVLTNADVVVLTLPLTEDTKGLIDHKRLSLMPDGAVLINISRGGVIDQQALVQELKTGRISAVLDVFEEEPLAWDSPLWDMDNVIITPHNSFVGDGNSERLGHVIMQNIKRAALLPGD